MINPDEWNQRSKFQFNPRKQLSKSYVMDVALPNFNLFMFVLLFLKFISAYFVMLLKPVNTVSLAKLMTTETELVK